MEFWSKKDQWLPEVQGERGKEGRIGGDREIFRAMKLFCLVLYSSIPDMVHLSNPENCTTQKENRM